MPSPPLVISNAVQLRLLWNIGGALGVNVYGGSHVGTVTVNQGLANTLGTAIKGQFTTLLAPHMGAAVSLVRVGIRSLGAANLPEFRDTGAAAPGTGTGDLIPFQNALCVTLRTAGSGKSFRGRTYFSGFTEATNDATGKILANTATAAVQFVSGIQSSMNTSALTLCQLTRPAFASITERRTTLADGTVDTKVLSRVSSKPGTAHAVTIIESRDLFWETQRRRVNQRGAVPTIISGNSIMQFVDGELIAPTAQEADGTQFALT